MTSLKFGITFKRNYKMKFTTEQLNTLSAWEDNFRTAVMAQWARNPGSKALRVIWQIYTSATGDQRRFSDNCNTCILHLLQDCGKVYFQDKEELAMRESSAKEVKVSQEAKEVVKKARVRTTRKAK